MLQSKPVDPGNFSGRATSFSSNSSLLELGHLENIKPYKMETGKIYLWIIHSNFKIDLFEKKLSSSITILYQNI